MKTKIPESKRPMLTEHYRKLLEAKRKAEDALQKCIADLLAFEVVLHKPIVLFDWPGHTQARLRSQLMQLEDANTTKAWPPGEYPYPDGAPAHIPSHD